MQTFTALVAAAALFQHALAIKMTSVTDHGANSKDKEYIQLPGLHDVHKKLQTTQDGLMSKIEAVKLRLSTELDKSRSLIDAKHSALDAQLMAEQKKTEQLEEENVDLEEDINELNQSNAERLQNITALNSTNQQLRKQLAALKTQIDEDKQSLVSSIDDSSDARVAAILQGTSENENNSEQNPSPQTNSNSDSDSDDDADDNKPLSFLAVSRQLRGSKDDDSEAETSLEDASEAPEDEADTKKAAASAPEDDPVANLLTEGLKQLDDEAKQETEKIQKSFDTQMALCKKKTQEQVDKKASLNATLKTMKDYELQLQAADKELKTAKAALLSMVAKQTAFFSRAAQKLEKLENAQDDDRKSTDCAGSDCGPEEDGNGDLKSEIKHKGVSLKIEAESPKNVVDQKSVDAIVAMGFAPSDARTALQHNGGSVAAASAELNASVPTH